MLAKIIPESTRGMKPCLTCPASHSIAPSTASDASSIAPRWRIEARRVSPYQSRKRLKPASNARDSGLPGGACASPRAHSIGVSVSATTPDSSTATPMLTANSWNSRPIMPPMNRIGRNTAASEIVIDSTVKPISCAPSSAACMRDFPISRWRAMFSITTTASSTTKPIASVIAIRLRLLRL